MPGLSSLRNIEFGQKKFLIPASIFLLLLIARAVLPSYVLKKTNQLLATFSPVISFHVADMDISIIRGAYRFEQVVGTVKDTNQTFVKIKSIDVSVAWREIFKGKLLTDIVAEKLDFLLIKDFKKLMSQKRESKKVKNKIFPLKIERFDLIDSSLALEQVKSFTDSSHFKISNIDGRVTNLTPNENLPLSFLNLTANAVDPNAKFKIVGKINQLKKPMAWDVDIEVKDFNLKMLNPYLKRNVPLTFTKGSADVYSEVNSDEGVMRGYIKPFLRDLDIIASREKFGSVKQIGVELITALANIILDEPKTKSVATILDFTYDKKFQLNKRKGVSKAIQHGFKQQLSPGIEERYNLQ